MCSPGAHLLVGDAPCLLETPPLLPFLSLNHFEGSFDGACDEQFQEKWYSDGVLKVVKESLAQTKF